LDPASFVVETDFAQLFVNGLVKSTPGVNFTSNLLTAFMSADPLKRKNTVKSSVFFAFLGVSNSFE